MLRYLVLLLLLPFVDLWLLVEIASSIGFLETLAIVVVTGLVGAELLRREGKFVFRKLGRSVTAEEMSRNFLEAALLVASGIMLLTPGIISDFLGFLLVLRPVRERLVVKLSEKIGSDLEFQVVQF